MRDPENIQGLIELKPDFMGFIFYPKSPRFAEDLDDELMMRIPLSIHKVGVFVNEEIDQILNYANRFGLEYIQLHGDEDVEFVKALKGKGLKIIKVFRLMDSIPVVASHYVGVADYLLFDTASNAYGGSGRHFDWNILKNYNLEIPFMLSGGVGMEDLEEIKNMQLKQLIGIDVNSRFETAPGEKNLAMLKELKTTL